MARGLIATITVVAAIGSGQTWIGGIPPRMEDVNWPYATLPAAACEATGPIHLQNHGDRLTRTGFGDVHSVKNPDQVLVSAAYDVAYGKLAGVGGVAAVDVMCANNGGTADGQLRSDRVVYGHPTSNPKVIGIITTRQPASEHADHVPLIGKVTVSGGTITASEAWYGPQDPTCCSSGRATTTWAYRGGKLRAVKTVVTRRPAHT